MKSLILTALLLGAAFNASAQHMLQPQEADPAHPATQVASAVAEALLTADHDRARTAIIALSSPAYASAALDDDVRALVDALGAPGAYRVDRVMLGMANGMLVVFRSASESEERLAVAVEMEAEAPHRVTRIRPARVLFRTSP